MKSEGHYHQKAIPVTLPFLNTGKIYYNICPSNRIAYETQKAYIKEEGKREREGERKWDRRNTYSIECNALKCNLIRFN